MASVFDFYNSLPKRDDYDFVYDCVLSSSGVNGLDEFLSALSKFEIISY